MIKSAFLGSLSINFILTVALVSIITDKNPLEEKVAQQETYIKELEDQLIEKIETPKVIPPKVEPKVIEPLIPDLTQPKVEVPKIIPPKVIPPKVEPTVTQQNYTPNNRKILWRIRRR